MQTIEIESFSEFLEKINSIQSKFDTFIYRGQANKSWKVESGVYRRIQLSKIKAKIKGIKIKEKEIIEYLHDALSEVRKRISSHQFSDINILNDIDLLVEMQHYGGATNLIDFSYNSLIALFFASADSQEVDGCVFCINNSNTSKSLSTLTKSLNDLFPISQANFYAFSPNHSNRRIIKQDSIFIFNDIGYIDDTLIDYAFIIKSASKQKIIQELKHIVGISEESIYPDFLGYLQANSAIKPFKIKNAQDYFEQAIQAHKRRSYTEAVIFYERSLALDSNQPKAYAGMAQCLRRLKKYEDALKMCLEGIRFKEIEFPFYIEIAVINTYLHDYEEAKLNFEKAKNCIKTEANNASYLINLGWMYLVFNELEKAKQILLNLNTANPYHRAINLGHCYLLEENEEEAYKYYLISMNNASTEDQFWNSFDSDYESIRKLKVAFPEEKYEALKEKLKKILTPC